MCAGAVAGLVGITPAAGYVTAMWALLFGFVTVRILLAAARHDVCTHAALLRLLLLPSQPYLSRMQVLVVFFQPRIIKRVFRVDDRLDCYAFHGAGGITGSLLTGLFASTANGSPVDGAFYGNPMLLWHEIAAILVVIVWATVATTLICLLLRFLAKVTGGSLLLDDELGADSGEHGEQAYFRGAERFVDKGLTSYEVYGADARAGTGASRSTTEAHHHVCASCGHVSVLSAHAPAGHPVLQPTAASAAGLHHRFKHAAPTDSAVPHGGLSGAAIAVEEPQCDSLQLPPAVFLQLEASLAMMGTVQSSVPTQHKPITRAEPLVVTACDNDAAATTSSATLATDSASVSVAAVTPPAVGFDLQHPDSASDERT